MAEWGKKRNGRGAVSTEDMLEDENNRLADNLAAKVSQLKSIALDIHDETEEQNRHLNGMDNEFDSTHGLLGGSFKRVQGMIQSGRGNRKLMCYITLFLVAFFFVTYFLMEKVLSR
ncbi:BET1-like protein isoform X2 [Saccoglossus kowalevskii]|uniref:BET1-like protein-like n=1 Tax=Saccoglossus kowalevskii TaxID=10224 RepID=A0ABM0GPG5_SACKO|nr:PREDICTED: BET1-like protein-like [Saccoglossus kowalevskii]